MKSLFGIEGIIPATPVIYTDASCKTIDFDAVREHFRFLLDHDLFFPLLFLGRLIGITAIELWRPAREVSSPSRRTTIPTLSLSISTTYPSDMTSPSAGRVGVLLCSDCEGCYEGRA